MSKREMFKDGEEVVARCSIRASRMSASRGEREGVNERDHRTSPPCVLSDHSSQFASDREILADSQNGEMVEHGDRKVSGRRNDKQTDQKFRGEILISLPPPPDHCRLRSTACDTTIPISGAYRDARLRRHTRRFPTPSFSSFLDQHRTTASSPIISSLLQESVYQLGNPTGVALHSTLVTTGLAFSDFP